MSGRMPGRELLSLIPLALLACGDGTSSDKGPPPAAPSDLAAPTVTSGRIGLSWTDNATDELGFSVDRSPDGANWTEIGTPPADTTVFTDIGLTADTTYHYRVRAVGQGGYSGATTLMVRTTTMEWNGPPASPTSPTALTARQGHSAIYDSFNQRMVVFGGDDGAFLNQVWALSLADDDLTIQGANNWTLLTNSTPPTGRYQHSAIYDPVRQRMVVFGGFTGTFTNEIWTLTLPDVGTPTWSKLDLPFGPSSRVLHSAIYDPVNDRMVVFGGSSGIAVSSEIWALRFTGTGSPNWASLGSATIGTTTLELSEHTAIYDPAEQRMIVYGGGSGSAGLNGTVYSATLPAIGVPVWSVLTSSIPPVARSGAAAVYDSENRRMVVFGGYDVFGAPLDEVWALALSGIPAWTQVTPTGSAPPARAFFSGVYDSFWERMVVFAGYDPFNFVAVDALAWPLKF